MGGVDENKAVIRPFVEEVQNNQNWDVFDELNAEDFVNHSAPPGVPNDREGGKLYLAAFMGAFPDCRFTIDDMIAEGDQVVTKKTFTGTHTAELNGIPPTGKRGVAVRRHHASPRREDRRTLAHDGSAVLHATTRRHADLAQSASAGPSPGQPPLTPQPGTLRAPFSNDKAMRLGSGASVRERP